MDVAVVIDTQITEYLEDRKCALEEMKQAIQAVGANFQRVLVQLILPFLIPLIY